MARILNPGEIDTVAAAFVRVIVVAAPSLPLLADEISQSLRGMYPSII